MIIKVFRDYDDIQRGNNDEGVLSHNYSKGFEIMKKIEFMNHGMIKIVVIIALLSVLPFGCGGGGSGGGGDGDGGVGDDPDPYTLIEGGTEIGFSYSQSTDEAYTGIPAYAFKDGAGNVAILKQDVSTACFSGRCGDPPSNQIFSYDVDSQSIVESTDSYFSDPNALDNLPPFREAVVADFNNDGAEDIAFANHTEGMKDITEPDGWESVNYIMLSNNGTYELNVIHDFQGFTHSIAAADIDGDGDIDIYMGDAGDSDSPEENGPDDDGGYFLINDGTGNFTRHSQRLHYGVAHELVDLDNDGLPELVATMAVNDCWESGCIEEWGLRIYKRNDNGNYDVVASNINPLPVAPIFGDVGVGDLTIKYMYKGEEIELAYMGDVVSTDVDGNGFNDLIVLTNTHSGLEFISIFFNDGSYGFSLDTTRLDFEYSHANTLFLKIVDADEDGNDDILIQRVNGVFFYYLSEEIYYNDGTGYFDNDNRIGIPDITGTFEPTDCDQDGDLDFFITHGHDYYWEDDSVYSTVELYLNNRIN